MATFHIYSLIGGLSVAAALAANVPPNAPPKDAPVPIITIPAPQPPAQETYIYDQKPITGRPVLVSPEQATGVITRFKERYASLGSPRVLIYVNRELVDEQSGMKMVKRNEKVTTSETSVDSNFKADTNATGQGAPAQLPQGGNVTIVGDVSGNALRTPGAGTVKTKTERATRDHDYTFQQKPQAALADKQTARDVERLFGRPLRMAGVSVVDQKTAALLIEDRPLNTVVNSGLGEQARKDREAISKIADVALEVLISSRNVNVAGISGDQTYSVPDIQATAIRLSDSKILGQTTSSDIIGKDRYAGHIARNFDVREIAEATALALMEDILVDPRAEQ